jgi:penicillin-binding protein 2
MKFHINKKRINKDIDPDEIFLDSKNLPNFNTQQFEGRLEKPIPKKIIFFVGSFFSIVLIAFSFKLVNIQITNGYSYFKKSENNTLMKEPIISPRGLIYDRNGEMLAWNSWEENKKNIEEDLDFKENNIPKRKYLYPGFSLLLGYVGSPAKDSSGNFWQDTFIGKDGLEKFYNTELTGENGVKITEKDVGGSIKSSNIMTQPKSGKDLYLSIDSRIQKKMFESISNMAQSSSFTGGAGAIMDLKTGELLSLVSYPEYNSNIISEGNDKNTIKSYFSDKRKVFLNRVVSGLYSPGSIVKPFVGYGALAENIISPFKKILSNGSISIPNPYFPGKDSVFKDHGVFGYVDIAEAIAVSSDVYFYEIGGGYKDQKGLGIVNIDKYIKMFGISDETGIDIPGEKSGTIPTPEWKSKVFKGEIWRVGDTYNTSIGQYGFQVTPIQMLRAVSGIANYGVFPTPHLIKDDESYKNKISYIDIDKKKMEIIHDGMRKAVLMGTAQALKLENVSVAAKSGTAQVGFGNTNTNSWIIGFFPYENPKYAFAVLMERGPKAASGNATRVMREVIEYMSIYTDEYFRDN